MDSIKIFVTIDGVKREMTIDSSQEAVVRRAAKLVDTMLVQVKSRWRVGGQNDYMSMVAFQLAYEKLLGEQQLQSDQIVEELNDLMIFLKK